MECHFLGTPAHCNHELTTTGITEGGGIRPVLLRASHGCGKGTLGLGETTGYWLIL